MNNIEIIKILQNECKFNKISLKIIKENNFPFHINATKYI